MRRLNRRRDVDALRRDRLAGRSIGLIVALYMLVVGAATSRRFSFSSALRQRICALRSVCSALATCGFRLRRLDRRQRADLDAHLAVLEQPLGQLQRAAANFDLLDRRPKVPVRRADVGLQVLDRRCSWMSAICR